LPISVCIISGAEAHRIGRALASVAAWTREVIVVLNTEVQDDTEAIALRFGAKVFREPWKGHIAQKNSAAAKATQPWLLGLDADEAVSPELRDELLALFADERSVSQFAGFSLAWTTCYCGRWIRHGDWRPSRRVRLCRQGRGVWGGVNPHDKLTVQGAVGRLRGGLHHYMADTPEQQVAKIIPYSAEFAAEMRMAGRHVSRLDLAVRPAWRFVRAYFLRLGFLDGWQGYHLACLSGFHAAMRYTKVWAAQRRTVEPVVTFAVPTDSAPGMKVKPASPA
jgi:glycosyltransferase involved in cell wall biosynthesis